MFLSKTITEDQAAALLRAARHAVANPDISDEDRRASLQVVDNIAGDIVAIFGGIKACDITQAAFGFAIVPGTQRHV